MNEDKNKNTVQSIDPLDKRFTKPASSLKQMAVPEDEKQVHTMPKKFLENAPVTHASGNRSTKFLVIGGVFFFIFVLAVFGVLLVRNQDSSAPSQTNTPVVKNLNGGNANTNVSTSNRSITNTNANQNKNVSQNTNTPVSNTNTSSQTNNSSSNTNSAPVSTSAVPDSVDTDHDDLTDVEEQLYGTRLSRSDSDADGFSDGEEVQNLYDPLGSGKLSTSPQVDLYKNIPFSYSVLYPIGLKAEAVDSTNETVLFTAPSGEFIEVLVFENKDEVTPRQWYVSQFQDKATPQDLVNKAGLKGVLAIDSSTVYFGNKEYIYGLSYHIGTKNEQSFATTFAMMYSSFVLTGDTVTIPPTNKNSNSNKNTQSNKNSNNNSSTNK